MWILLILFVYTLLFYNISISPSVPCTRINGPSLLSLVAILYTNNCWQAICPCDNGPMGHQSANFGDVAIV